MILALRVLRLQPPSSPFWSHLRPYFAVTAVIDFEIPPPPLSLSLSLCLYGYCRSKQIFTSSFPARSRTPSPPLGPTAKPRERGRQASKRQRKHCIGLKRTSCSIRFRVPWKVRRSPCTSRPLLGVALLGAKKSAAEEKSLTARWLAWMAWRGWRKGGKEGVLVPRPY